MASQGDMISYANLPTGWAESRTNIFNSGNGSSINGYFYISCPSFILEIRLSKDSWWAKSGWMDLDGTPYDWDNNTWGTERQLCNASGKPGGDVYTYWAHNCPPSTSGINSHVVEESKYSFWKIHVTSSSDTRTQCFWFAGYVGMVGESTYNSYYKGNPIYSCGNAVDNSKSFNSTSSHFIYVGSGWGQDDSGALEYFNRVSDRGTLITAENCKHISI